MLITFKRTYYEPHKNIYTKNKIDLEKGITVLCGCNGAGKTTFLHITEDFCRENNHPCIMYDNCTDNARLKMSDLFFRGGKDNYRKANLLMSSSEGESIRISLVDFIIELKNDFVVNKVRKSNNPFAVLFADKMEDKKAKLSNNLFILLDATDSGFSIDNICYIKEQLHLLINYVEKAYPDLSLYILISTNAFEFTMGEKCLDVLTMSYIDFTDYIDYRKYVLKTKKKILARYAKWDKVDEKEFIKKQQKEELRKKKEDEEADLDKRPSLRVKRF